MARGNHTGVVGPPGAILVDELELPRDVRRQAGELLGDQWGAAWRRTGYAGRHPPAFRALAFNGARRLIGHVSAFPLVCAPDLRVFGVGDLVVKRRYRRRGVARDVCAALVSECFERRAQAVLVDTVDAATVFAKLGFRSLDGFTFYYETERDCRRRRHWLMACTEPLPAPVQILEHGDF